MFHGASFKFQSTHPHGVRLSHSATSKQRNDCFNPRTHTGCDLWVYIVHSIGVVSIHAPTRGATLLVGLHTADTGVSIHAPTRGATLGLGVVGLIQHVSIHAPTRGATSIIDRGLYKFGFQSTHPHGVRQGQTSGQDCPLEVSIHAPTRGATSSCSSVPLYFLSFQSTHPHGVRRHFRAVMASVGLFQSTHPHGVRQTREGPFRSIATSFNPRTHTGCDTTTQFQGRKSKVSIHAPTRGATCIYPEVFMTMRVSIHAPTRGATWVRAKRSGLSCRVSIHAPTRGATTP